VESGRWLLYRYDPRRVLEQGENPLILDSRKPKRPLEQAMYSENRFKMLLRSKPEEAKTPAGPSPSGCGHPLALECRFWMADCRFSPPNS
jgi:pyruvate/2-oxoacid:ferredoxin oxidoreductase beta subunit